MKTWLSIGIFTILISCNKMNKTERSNEPTIFSLSENDKEMNDAIETAINNLNEFDSALKKSEYENFALKIKYDYEKGSEYIWATDIIKQENDYFGIIDNMPNSINDVKLGERIKIPKEKISDWMFSKNGKL